MAVEIIGRGIRPQDMSLRKQWCRRKYDRVIEAKGWLEVILGSEGSVISVGRLYAYLSTGRDLNVRLYVWHLSESQIHMFADSYPSLPWPSTSSDTTDSNWVDPSINARHWSVK